MQKAKVAIALNPSRIEGTIKTANLIGLPDFQDMVVFIKPNFNTADPPPGSTHIDSLRTVIRIIKEGGPRRIIVGDRSGPTSTRKVFMEKGILELSDELGFEHMILDELPDEYWEKYDPPGSHWRDGFYFAKPAIEADAVISLCCLKTHRFGGYFTMSLKLTTGLVHRKNMIELHSSVRKQRMMIAEMNYPYSPKLIIMDGVDSFYKGGPMKGASWKANLTFASKDRIAIDAVGLAALKMHGTTRHIQTKPIFEQDQIRRAVELNLGVSSPQEIEIVPVDEESSDVALKIEKILRAG
ncbi:MAG: DUF362 domain-containing protein [Thermoplasmata archaeon]|nr:DUF362 domain-containing protein [Thermoplasmata archaeon]